VCGLCLASVVHPADHALLLVAPPNASTPETKAPSLVVLTDSERQEKSTKKLALKRSKTKMRSEGPRVSLCAPGSFAARLKGIVFQKVSNNTGCAIFARFEALFEEGVTPVAVLAKDNADMLKCGLSKMKVESIKSAAKEPASVSKRSKKRKDLQSGETSTHAKAPSTTHRRGKVESKMITNGQKTAKRRRGGHKVHTKRRVR